MDPSGATRAAPAAPGLPARRRAAARGRCGPPGWLRLSAPGHAGSSPGGSGDDTGTGTGTARRLRLPEPGRTGSPRSAPRSG
ncbi:hypothetical protein CK936_27325, partial [Streptomyces albireticuli]